MIRGTGPSETHSLANMVVPHGRHIIEAGAVVFRLIDRTVHLLVLRSSDGTSWLFPKGHIEDGETAEQAALRETREEAGVKARVVAPLGTSEYVRREKRIDVAYFLVEYLGPAEPDEAREQRWCTCEEALELLSFENLKPIAAHACRTAHAHSSTPKSRLSKRLFRIWH